MKAFRINVNRCHGCYNCQIACKDEHCSNDWTPFAKPQPEWRHYWGKLEDHIRGSVGKALGDNPKIRMSSFCKVDYVWIPCQHCENAPCVAECPVDAIIVRSDGMTYIDPLLCTGCHRCIDRCPYGVIYYNTTLNIAQKCTGCAHLLERGWPISEPRCSDQCPTEAILFGEESELDLAGTETLHPEFGLTTRVHYLALPKKFIAGTVYDPSSKEIVEGATVTLSGDGSGTLTTDEFGDFWFDELGEGTFTVTITADGKTATVDNIDTTEKDVNLGDIALS